MKAVLRHIVFVLTLLAAGGYCGAVIACALPPDNSCTHNKHHHATDKHDEHSASKDCQSDSCSECPCHFPAYRPSTSVQTIVYSIPIITSDFKPSTLALPIEPFLRPPQA